VLFLGEVDDAVLGQLVDLAFDDAQRDVAQQADDLEASWLSASDIDFR
jgi:hypothetical protein